MARYARQEAIPGWDQDRLAGATLGIAGFGPTAFLTGLMATAMGFGRLVLFGGQRGECGGLPQPHLGTTESWAALYHRINPEIRAYPFPSRVSVELIDRLPALHGLIVAGNDPSAGEVGWRLARRGAFPVVAGGSSGRVGMWGTARPNAMAARFADRPESPLLSQIIAALLVDEVRKALMPLEVEEGCTQGRHLLSLPHLARALDSGRHPHRRPRRQPVALVGAGALGTWFGLALGWSGLPVEVSIYDFDEVDETNLNRQILFYDAVGKPKAPVLAARLQELFPRMKMAGYGMKADASTSRYLAEADVLAACPDNFQVRAFLDGLARDHRKLLVNAGTSAMGGSCMVYAPGTTACLRCRLDVEKLALLERRAQSCAQVEASVVTSNAITGALMAWSLREASAGRAPAGIWEYEARARSTRLGMHSDRPACRCHLA